MDVYVDLTQFIDVAAEISRIVTGLSTLAIAPQLDPSAAEPEELDRLVRRAAALLAIPISVVDRSLGLVADSTLPFGTPLPSTSVPNTAFQALESGRPALSDLQSNGSDGGAFHVMLMVPVTNGTQVIAALAARIDLGQLEQRLFETTGTRGALLLFDGQGRLLAGLGRDRVGRSAA